MENKIQLIGVAGTAGAGKDTAAALLSKIFGFENLSSGDVVRAITRHVYRLPANFNPVRDQLYEVANYARTQINPATMVLLCILQGQVLHVKGAVISGLRSMGEAEAVRAAGGIIIGVDADSRLRYGRIFDRARDAESQKTLEEFLQQDEYENRGLSDTGAGRGIRAIIDSADLLLTNNGTLQELEQAIKDKVTPILFANQ